MSAGSPNLVHEVLTCLLKGDPAKGDPGQGVGLLERAPTTPGQAPPPQVLAALRQAIRLPRQTLLYYLRLAGLWQRWGRPALKPNVVQRRLLLVADYTTDGLLPLFPLFGAAYGLDLSVQTTPFDSVEQIALGAAGALGITSEHVVVVSLSEHWLTRYLGNGPLVEETKLVQVQEVLAGVVNNLQAQGPAGLLMTNFPERIYSRPGGWAGAGSLLGWNRALNRLNDWLVSGTAFQVPVLDLAEAVHAAGGQAVLGRRSYFRSKMIFEPAGTIAAAREIVGGLAQATGKTHRALVADWDNTLWGGEVAEVGSHGVTCSLDSADGLAYHQVQAYLQGLKSLGVLLAGASRNDPAVQSIFEENPNLALKLDDFASVQVAFQPKSEALARISADLGFGQEFMVFLDDSLFELTEVLTAHPAIDVVLAGPEPEMTLQKLSDARLFSTHTLSQEDLQRHDAALQLKKQRSAQSSFASLEDFLRSIHIQLDVAPLTAQNMARVVQMLQKSNQFNLTTRRHTETDLHRFQEEGSIFGVFSYRDDFGPQGVIAVVHLQRHSAGLAIESWVMSCRVLNRTVEQAVFHWIVEQAQGMPIMGQFLPTQKNRLVADLYQRLGFELATREMTGGAETWRFDGSVPAHNLPSHFADLREAA